MTPKVIRSVRYQDDISSILTYIAHQSGSRSVARNFLFELRERISQYSRQPEMGTVCDELLPELRCFTFKRNYVVYYQEIKQGIVLIRILHGARDIDLMDFI